MLENNITKDEEIKVYSQKLNILKWEKEFEECLKFNLQRDFELFPVDKLWFQKYKKEVLSDGIPIEKKIENYHLFEPLDNSSILHDMKSINPESDFVFLNKDCIDGFSPSVKRNKQFDIKLIGRFINGKMISRIGKNLYYIFFIDNNTIREGLLIFGNYNIDLINQIINKFLNSDINLFINNYFYGRFSQNNKFRIYHRNEFDFLIKLKENENKSSLKVISIPRINGNIKINTTDIEKGKPKRNFKLSLDNNQYNLMKNNNFKSDNVNDIIKENGLNKIYKNDSSNLAKCILEYFYSENELNNFIKDKIKFKTLNIINKQWLDEFKNAVNYENIKDELSKIKNSAIYEQIVSNYINNNNLNEISLGNHNLDHKEFDIKNGQKHFYYNDYQLLTKKSFGEFFRIFNLQNNNKTYNSYFLDRNNIFIQYDESSGEIIKYTESDIEHEYFIMSKSKLKDIINCLQRNGVIKGLSFLGYRNNEENDNDNEIKLIDPNKKKIGTLKILNIPHIPKENNNNNLYNDDEIIDNDEKVFEDNNHKNMKKKDIYYPKIINKKKRFLKKSIKNVEKKEDEEEEEKEEEEDEDEKEEEDDNGFSKTFTNLSMKRKKSPKKSPKKFSQKSSKKQINYIYEEEEDKNNYDNNVNESIKNLRNSQVDKKFENVETKDVFGAIKTISKTIKIETPKSNSSKMQQKNSINNFNEPIKKVTKTIKIDSPNLNKNQKNSINNFNSPSKKIKIEF